MIKLIYQDKREIKKRTGVELLIKTDTPFLLELYNRFNMAPSA